MAAGVILDRDGVSPSEVVLPLCLCVCGSIMLMCSGIDSSSIGRRLETGTGDMRQRQRQPGRVQRQARRCRRLGCGMRGAGPRSGACHRWWRRRQRLLLRLLRLLNRRRCGAMQRGTGTCGCSRRHWRQLDAGTWLVLVVLMLRLRCCDCLYRIGGMRHPRLLDPLHLHGSASLCLVQGWRGRVS